MELFTKCETCAGRGNDGDSLCQACSGEGYVAADDITVIRAAQAICDSIQGWAERVADAAGAFESAIWAASGRLPERISGATEEKEA